MRHYRIYLIIILCSIVFGVVSQYPEIFHIETFFQQKNYQYKTTLVYEAIYNQDPPTITTRNTNLQSNERYWLSGLTQIGTIGYAINTYEVTFDNLGLTIDKRLVATDENGIPARPYVYTQGVAARIGSYFTPSFTRYGVNCKTCAGEFSGQGGFAAGIIANVNYGVKQFNGKWKPGITYEGYYIVASDPAIPLCSILKIENHYYQGMGLDPAIPFYAVVLDRGGAIKNNRLDFYIGDERTYNDFVKLAKKRVPKATIIHFGKRVRNSLGQRACQLPDIKTLT
jgi:3D (Asp-Asp-Asp) domain-containing protein